MDVFPKPFIQAKMDVVECCETVPFFIESITSMLYDPRITLHAIEPIVTRPMFRA
jgi:hypothetical protein